MTYIQTPIQTLSDAEGFFFQLEQNGKLFHPEDDPESVIDRHGKPLFTLSQCMHLRHRIEEAYRFMDDPCEYILSLDSYRIVDDNKRSYGQH
jgi:hypothetical protein